MTVKGKAVARAASAGALKKRGDAHRPPLPSVAKCHGNGTKAKPDLPAHSACKVLDKDVRQQWPFALNSGLTLRMGDYTLEIGAALGRGSFGKVWVAASTGLRSLAVKEICCHSPGAHVYALYEARVLQTLSWHMPDGVARRLPGFIASESVSIGPERWLMRLAMTRLPGTSLSKFLKKRSQSSLCKRPAQHCIQMAEACNLARELLSQLAPAFEHISKFVYHRDVNPQNITIDYEAATPQFGLIDFGLATDAERWRTDVSSASSPSKPGLFMLQRCNVVGNGCFWPSSSWLALSHGPEVLTSHPELRFEFAECLDFHGLGLVAMKIIAEALPAAPSSHECRGGCGEDCACNNRVISRFISLQKAWDNYWRDVSRCWRQVMETPKDGSSMNTLRSEFVRLDIPKMLQNDIKKLHRSLRQASCACLSEPGAAVLSDAPKVLDAISLMINGGAQPCVRPSWSTLKSDVDSLALQAPSEQKRSTRSVRTPPYVKRAISPLIATTSCRKASAVSEGCPVTWCSQLSSRTDFTGTDACSSDYAPPTTAPPSGNLPPLSDAASSKESVPTE